MPRRLPAKGQALRAQGRRGFWKLRCAFAREDGTLVRVLKQQALPLDSAMMLRPRSQFPEKAASLVEPFPFLWDEIGSRTFTLPFLLSLSVPARTAFPSFPPSHPQRRQKLQHPCGHGRLCEIGWVSSVRRSAPGMRSGAAFGGLPVPQKRCLASASNVRAFLKRPMPYFPGYSPAEAERRCFPS